MDGSGVEGELGLWTRAVQRRAGKAVIFEMRDAEIPRNLGKKTPASYNNTMEDYEYKVINLHATLFQNSSKFTGDISRNTSKSTSETNQMRPAPVCKPYLVILCPYVPCFLTDDGIEEPNGSQVSSGDGACSPLY